jgi:aspartyl-tRNA(Asn)/glutamyl-tRNA(Gln) amidotransferase subunit C
VVTDGDQQAQILTNAPDAREGFFAVPKVVE